ncbi:MAG: hypothetical protein Fur0022_35470 [Anaerolineales bacterium]
MTLLHDKALSTHYGFLPPNGDDVVEQLTSIYRHLVDTYESTIQGWILALELHDGESRAHAFRVAEMAVRLATEVGIKEPMLPHIRHGALLHDIGKLGVPGSILKKNGPLTNEEWVIMQKHPALAHELLAPIKFLEPALDIPIYHHEKWDGSGYPHGLRGEQIPLAARIFTVVDVWDALRSNRPYRTEAWSDKKIATYLQQQAGHSFDPMIVKTFVKLLTQQLPNRRAVVDSHSTPQYNQPNLIISSLLGGVSG